MRAVRVAWFIVGLGVWAATEAEETSPRPALPGLVEFNAPRFPMEIRGVKYGDGHALVAFTIDARGAVNDTFAVMASHEAFARAASGAIADWRFDPAVSALPRREMVEFEFRRQGVVTSLTHTESASDLFLSTTASMPRTVQWKDLDAVPQRLAGDMPAVSKAALGKLGNAPLMISFVVDESGRVRVPAVNIADDPQLAEQVLAAVRQWRYSPPLYKGAPAAAEVTRSLVLGGTAGR